MAKHHRGAKRNLPIPRTRSVMVCAKTGKRCYVTRKDAKNAAHLNHPGDHQTAYLCRGEGACDLWHYGHLDPERLHRGI